MAFDIIEPEWIPNLKLEKPIALEAGEILFVIGANGKGKSALAHEIYKKYQSSANYIAAHRQNWIEFSKTFPLFDIAHRSIKDHDLRDQARYKDTKVYDRTTLVLHDLCDANNHANQKIIDCMTNKNENINQEDLLKTVENMEKKTPKEILNRLLQEANMDIAISIRGNSINAISNNKPYNIEQLSHGERNALLLVASVLLTPQNHLLIIDEPESHLHYSIIAPLLSALFAERQDCSFVIATHSLDLPQDTPNSDILALRKVNLDKTEWEADLIKNVEEIDDNIRTAILGPKRKMLFVEGDRNSLDCKIYEILFPKISVISQGSCYDVECAVNGVRKINSLSLPWAKAFGLIDGDARSDLDELKNKGIYSLKGYAVESIYYSEKIIKRVANDMGVKDIDKVLNDAKEIIDKQKDNLCIKVCEQKIKNYIKYPEKINFEKGGSFNFGSENLGSLLDKEKETFDTLDIHGLISRYSIKTSGVPKKIATGLNITNTKTYEIKVQRILREDKNLRNQIIEESLKDLAVAINEPEETQAETSLNGSPPTEAHATT